MTIDTHCHLTMAPLSASTAAVLTRASNRGITDMIIPAYDRASWSAMVSLIALAATESAPRLHQTCGYHPWLAHEVDSPAALAALADHIRQNNPVAIGEIGLDTKPKPTLDQPTLNHQLSVLDAQLQLAVDHDLPVILHCRGAIPELLNALANHRGRVCGVLHAFSRGPEVGERFIAAGLHLGLGGVITRSHAKRVREAAVQLPLEKLLLETDAPNLGLAGVPASKTEPAHIADIAIVLAELRGQEIAHIAAATTVNARELFRLPPGPEV